MMKFTLMEMLVVIAILGILISLLLPSLQNAREVAKSAVCIKNLQNVGVADMLYLQENNNWFNSNQPVANVGIERWAKNLEFRKYTGWDVVTPVWMIPNELACPESIEKCRSQGVDYNSVSVKDLRTYGPFAIYGGKAYRGLKAEWILAPSQLGRAGDIWGGWQFSQNAYDARHNNKANMLYYDGHVVSRSNASIGSSYNADDPWVDSNGWNLTNINDYMH